MSVKQPTGAVDNFVEKYAGIVPTARLARPGLKLMTKRALQISMKSTTYQEESSSLTTRTGFDASFCPVWSTLVPWPSEKRTNTDVRAHHA